MAKLPPLKPPRKTPEADITPRVMQYFKENYPRSALIEIKIGNRPLVGHQEKSLQEVADGVFVYKLPDQGVRTPADVVLFKDADAIVVRCKGNKCNAEVLNTGEVIHFEVWFVLASPLLVW